MKQHAQNTTNYAQNHDDCMWRGLCQLLEDNNPNTLQNSMHRSIAEIPARAGGLGLGNSVRTSSAAYWAAWADALPVLISKLPEDARSLQRQLESPQCLSPCLREARSAAQVLSAEGFNALPSWQSLVDGCRPPIPGINEEAELGDWPHGWQFYANRTRNTFYVCTALMPTLDASS